MPENAPKAPRIHRSYRLPVQTSEEIKRRAKAQGISEADVIANAVDGVEPLAPLALTPTPAAKKVEPKPAKPVPFIAEAVLHKSEIVPLKWADILPRPRGGPILKPGHKSL